MDCIVLGVTKSQTGLSDFHFHILVIIISATMNMCVQECSNYCTIALILHASKVTLKILQGRFQQYMNLEPPDVQAGFRKGRGK